MSAINSVMHAISDHGNAIASKVITYFGVVSIGSGGALGVASGTAEKLAQNQSFGLPDWAAVVSIVGGVCLIIKNSIDAYYTVKDRRQRNIERRQQERRDYDRKLSQVAESYLDEDK